MDSDAFVLPDGLDEQGLSLRAALPKMGYEEAPDYVEKLDNYVRNKEKAQGGRNAKSPARRRKASVTDTEPVRRDSVTSVSSAVSENGESDSLDQTLAGGEAYAGLLDLDEAAAYKDSVEAVLDIDLRPVLRSLSATSHAVFGRLARLNGGSREPLIVTVVLALHEMDRSNCDDYRRAVSALVREQLAHTKAFNLVRCEGVTASCCFDKAVPPTPLALQKAELWAEKLNALDKDDPKPDVLDGVEWALADGCNTVIFVADTPNISCLSLVLSKVRQSRVPFHSVAFNLHESETAPVREVASASGGRHHGFYIESGDLSDMLDHTGMGDVAFENEEIQAVQVRTRLCTNTLAVMSVLILERESHLRRELAPQSTAEWLEVYGYKAQKLTYEDVRKPCTFPHVHGDAALQRRPHTSPDDLAWRSVPAAWLCSSHTESTHCENLPSHTRDDGVICHVYISEGIAQTFERRGSASMEQYATRARKMMNSSMGLFGVVREDVVMIVVACNKSVDEKWSKIYKVVKRLVKDQIQGEARDVHLMVYGETAKVWAPRGDLEHYATPDACEDALSWLRNQDQDGASDVAEAMRAAFEQCQEHNIREMYLLSDGAHHGVREDIYTAVRKGYSTCGHRPRINCLSFGGEREGNQMLHDLSVCGDGGFQYYLADLGRGQLDERTLPLLGPLPRGGMDEIMVLREQMLYVRQEMNLVRAARDKCATHDKLLIQARKRAEAAVQSHVPRFAPARTHLPFAGKSLTAGVSVAGAAELHRSKWSGRVLPGHEKGVWEKYGRPEPEEAMYKPISDAADIERQQILAIERKGPWEVPKTGKLCFVVASNSTMRGWWSQMVRIMKAMFHEKVAGGDLDFNVMVAGVEPKLWWVPEPIPQQQQQQQHAFGGSGGNHDDNDESFGHGCVVGSPEACADALSWLVNNEPSDNRSRETVSTSGETYAANGKKEGKAPVAASSSTATPTAAVDAVAIGKAALAVGDTMAASVATSKRHRHAAPSESDGGGGDASGAEEMEAKDAVDSAIAFDPIAALEVAAKLVGDGGTILLFSDGGHLGTTKEVLRRTRQIAAGRKMQAVALDAAKELNATLTAEHKEATASAQEQAQLALAETLRKLPPTISVVSFGKNPDRVRLLHNMAVLGNGGFNQQITRKLEGSALKSFTQRMAAQPNRTLKRDDDASRTRTWTLGGDRASQHYSSCHCPQCDPTLAGKRKATRKLAAPDLGVVAARDGAGFGVGHVSSSVWLESQSLEALKLTIRHILRPVAIKRRPTSFKIGKAKKNVTSKVFDDVYRTARVFDEHFEHEFDMFIAVPPANRCTYWVDMSQAHIDVYVSRLDAVLGVYRARLLAIALAVDPSGDHPSNPAEFNGDSAVESSDWIAALKDAHSDIAYMLEEIGKAKGFLSRAERWERDAPSPVSNSNNGFGGTAGSSGVDLDSKPRLTTDARLMGAAAAATDRGSTYSGISTASVIETLRNVVGRGSHGVHGGVSGGFGEYRAGSAGTLHAAKSVYSKTSPALPPGSGIGRPQRAPPSKHKAAGTRSLLLGVGLVNPGHASNHIGAGLTKKQRGGRKSTDVRPRIFPFRSSTVDLGERVLVRRWEDGVHVPGHVRSMPNNHSYDILFDNGKFQITPRSYLFMFPEPEYPYVKPRDFVLAPAEGVDGYLPAKVIAVNYDGRAVVEFHGGFRSAHHRPAMVKLTAGEYKAIKAYYCDGYLRHQLLQEEKTVADVFEERRSTSAGGKSLHSAVHHGSSATVGLGGKEHTGSTYREVEEDGGGYGGGYGSDTFSLNGAHEAAGAVETNTFEVGRATAATIRAVAQNNQSRMRENLNHLIPESDSAAPLVAKLLEPTNGMQTWQLLEAPEQDGDGVPLALSASSQFSSSSSVGGRGHETGIEVTVLIFMGGAEHSASANKILAACARAQCRAVIDVEAEFTADEAEMICAEINVSLRWPIADQLTSKVSHSVLLQGPGAIRRVQDAVERSGLDGGSVAVPTCIASRSATEALQQASVVFVPGSGPFRTALDPECTLDSEMTAGAHQPNHPLSQQSALVQSGEDGWFYPGVVLDHIVANFFAFEDEHGNVASADIRDLLFESHWSFPTKISEYVLAEHPSYTQAYGPGKVVEVVDIETEGEIPGVTVEFFDGSSKLMVSSQCILITESKSKAIRSCLRNASA